MNAKVNHFHNFLFILTIEFCKNFSDNLWNTTNARIPNNREPLPRNRKANKLSFKFIQNSKGSLKVTEISREACTEVNLWKSDTSFLDTSSNTFTVSWATSENFNVLEDVFFHEILRFLILFFWLNFLACAFYEKMTVCLQSH